MRVRAAHLCLTTALTAFGGTVETRTAAFALARTDRTETVQEETFAVIHDRAAAAYISGKWDKALAGFTAAIALNPQSALAFYNRGNVHYAKGDFAAAVADFTEALRLNPVLPYAHMNRGNALSNLGRFHEALHDLNEAARLQPQVSDVYFNRAILHVRNRNLDKALADYELAIARDGNDQDAKAARERLLKLIKVRDGREPATQIDTVQITTEIAHARYVEHFLRLASESCVKRGDNLESLEALALVGKWKSATPEDLTRGSTADAQLDAGWIFADRFGTFALIRSTSKSMPPVRVCSLTTRPVNDHIFDDLKNGFESRFAGQLVDDPETAQTTTSRRYRMTTANGNVLVYFGLVPERKTLTFKTYLGER